MICFLAWLLGKAERKARLLNASLGNSDNRCQLLRDTIKADREHFVKMEQALKVEKERVLIHNNDAAQYCHERNLAKQALTDFQVGAAAEAEALVKEIDAARHREKELQGKLEDNERETARLNRFISSLEHTSRRASEDMQARVDEMDQQRARAVAVKTATEGELSNLLRRIVRLRSLAKQLHVELFQELDNYSPVLVPIEQTQVELKGGE